MKRRLLGGVALGAWLMVGCSSNGGLDDGSGTTGGGTSGGTTGGTTGGGTTGGTDGSGTTGGGTDGSTSGGGSDAATGTTEKFSFFVTSQKAMQKYSGNTKGFGGDLRFGETGAGAGLRGADKLCATIAEASLPGAGQKTWRAFLSASDDGTGKVVNAIDRVGDGPWYDRLGRVFSLTKADLLNTRPASADAAIKNDFPNEDGVPNHAPDGTKVDNHDFLTGTDENGKLYAKTATCLDWTANAGNKTTEGVPHCGHSWPRNTGGGGGGGGGGGDIDSWMSSLDESGCAPGGSTVEMGGPKASDNTVGSGGGYGGIYCFALEP